MISIKIISISGDILVKRNFIRSETLPEVLGLRAYNQNPILEIIADQLSKNSIKANLKRDAIPAQDIHLNNFMLVLQTHLFSKVYILDLFGEPL